MRSCRQIPVAALRGGRASRDTTLSYIVFAPPPNHDGRRASSLYQFGGGARGAARRRDARSAPASSYHASSDTTERHVAADACRWRAPATNLGRSLLAEPLLHARACSCRASWQQCTQPPPCAVDATPEPCRSASGEPTVICTDISAAHAQARPTRLRIGTRHGIELQLPIVAPLVQCTGSMGAACGRRTARDARREMLRRRRRCW